MERRELRWISGLMLWCLLMITSVDGQRSGVPTGAQPVAVTRPRVWPTSGPRSGGTVITIQHQDVPQLNSWGISIGNQSCLFLYTRGDKVICNTTSLQQKNLLNQPLKVQLYQVLKGLGTVPPQLPGVTFTYREDPYILEVYPRATLVGGGTNLTVVGGYLDTVAHPVMTLTVEVGGSVFNHNTNCTVLTADKMVCPTPALPELQVYQTSRNTKFNRRKRSVMRRDTIQQSYLQSSCSHDPLLNDGLNALTDMPDIEVYISSFLLDGVTHYLDYQGVVEEDANVDVFGNPYFYLLEEKDRVFRPFWPYEENHIKIKGEGLLIGPCPEMMYTVQVGQSSCSNILVSEGSIACSPPKQRPPGDLHVMIHVGGLSFDVGELVYHGFWDSVLVKVLVIGGAAAVLIIIISCGIVYSCAKKKRKSKEHGKNPNPDQTGYLQENKSAHKKGPQFTPEGSIYADQKI